MATQIICFTTTGWGGTDALVSLGELSFELLGQGNYYSVSTIDRAFVLASSFDAGDDVIVAPMPSVVIDGNQHGFFDAGGFPLQTVTVPLGATLMINRAITICGGAYRLRIDGVGAYRIASSEVVAFIDVDIVNLTATNASCINTANATSFTRCLLANLTNDRQAVISSSTIFTDCVLFGCQTSYSGYHWTTLNSTFARCTLLFVQDDYRNTKTDCITSIDAGFVNAPPSDLTDFSAFDSYDLHLTSTSSYATGGTSVTSGSTVYGLDGLPRKVGGALGAYEVYAATHYARTWLGYATRTYDDGATGDVYVAQDLGSTRHRLAFLPSSNAVGIWRRWSSSDEWTYFSTTAFTGGAYTNDMINGCEYRVGEMDSDHNPTGGCAYYTLYYNSTPPSDATIIKALWSNRYSWNTDLTFATSSGAAPSGASICWLETNGAWHDETAAVDQIIVPGCRHVDIGNNGYGAEIILGLGATCERWTSGAITDVFGKEWQELAMRVLGLPFNDETFVHNF